MPSLAVMPKLQFNIDKVTLVSDLRDSPAYTISEASHYLRIPKSTIRAWTVGTTTGSGEQKRPFKPLIALPSRQPYLLSFNNLAEVVVARCLTKQYGVRLQAVRKALDYVSQETRWDRPLIQQDFRTDGVSLFVKGIHGMVDAVDPEQKLIPGLLDKMLERIDWENQLAARLYPLTRTSLTRESPRLVVIDPSRSFGRPIVDRLGVTTNVIFERYQAGDSRALLAKEYGASQEDIDEAIRCEAPSAIAA